MTLRLLLIRHGLSSYNRENRIQGRNDLSTLTPEGISQASKIGESLQGLPIHAIYSSPLKRASDTASELLRVHSKSKNIIIDNDLLEVDLAPWSGLTIEEVKKQFPNAYLTWKKSPSELTLKREDGITYNPIQELMDQAEKFLEKIFLTHESDKDENIILVAHNAILRCLILKLLGNPKDGLRRIRLDNASLSIFNIEIDNGTPVGIQIESLNSTAHLKPRFPSKGRHGRMILVRHGETDWNKEGRFQGQIDVPLNTNGKKQAIAAGEFLKEVNFDRVFSSCMSRPTETAKIILEAHPALAIQAKSDLKEISHGLWEGKLESEIKSDWGELLLAWQTDPENVQMPEGENIKDVSIRAIKCWESIRNSLLPHETVLIVAHDAVNKTILCNLLGLSNSDIWKIKQGNGAISIVDITEDSSLPDIVSSLNITSHLGGVIDTTAQGAL